MSTAVGWAFTLVMVNYVVFFLTGYPVVWCWLLAASKPLALYAATVNLSLAAGIVAGGVWYGPAMAIKVAVLMIVFNLVPSVLEALMGFGYRCA